MLPAVPLIDYGRQYRELWDEVQQALRRTFLEDQPVLGQEVNLFEQALAGAHQVKHAVGVGSGTSAIMLALRALGLGSGDEVITAAYNFVGVVSAIALVGATPVLVDVQDPSGLLDPNAVAMAVGKRTRAIVAVHLYGHPADMEALAQISDYSRAILVEDGSQAHGARLWDRPIGGFGSACALSFHPSKNLGAFGDGGAVLTNDPVVAERVRVASNLGRPNGGEATQASDTSRLDTIQAAILNVKLRHLESWIDRRRALVARYRAGLADLDGLTLPPEAEGVRHAYCQFVVRTRERDGLANFLAGHNVASAPASSLAAYLHPAHASRFAGQSFPVAQSFAAEGLRLPLSHEHQENEIDRVIETVRFFFR